MPFNNSDRDTIRDLFGYTWEDHSWIDAYLSDAFNEHGETVVSYIRDRFDELESLAAKQTEAATAEAENVTKVDVYQEVSIEKNAGMAIMKNAGIRQKLINEIARAIALYPNQTTLRRS